MSQQGSTSVADSQTQGFFRKNLVSIFCQVTSLAAAPRAGDVGYPKCACGGAERPEPGGAGLLGQPRSGNPWSVCVERELLARAQVQAVHAGKRSAHAAMPVAHVHLKSVQSPPSQAGSLLSSLISPGLLLAAGTAGQSAACAEPIQAGRGPDLSSALLCGCSCLSLLGE